MYRTDTVRLTTCVNRISPRPPLRYEINPLRWSDPGVRAGTVRLTTRVNRISPRSPLRCEINVLRWSDPGGSAYTRRMTRIAALGLLLAPLLATAQDDAAFSLGIPTIDNIASASARLQQAVADGFVRRTFMDQEAEKEARLNEEQAIVAFRRQRRAEREAVAEERQHDLAFDMPMYNAVRNRAGLPPAPPPGGGYIVIHRVAGARRDPLAGIPPTPVLEPVHEPAGIVYR